jgi:hypothetical protein
MPCPCRYLAMTCRVKSHITCRAPAVLLPCRAALIHTCHAEPPAILRQCRVLRESPRGIRKYPTARLLLVANFLELPVVAGRSRTRAGRPYAVSGRPMLIHTCRAMPIPFPCRAVPWPWEVALELHGRGTAWERHEMCESNTVALCKSNGEDTI